MYYSIQLYLAAILFLLFSLKVKKTTKLKLHCSSDNPVIKLHTASVDLSNCGVSYMWHGVINQSCIQHQLTHQIVEWTICDMESKFPKMHITGKESKIITNIAYLIVLWITRRQLFIFLSTKKYFNHHILSTIPFWWTIVHICQQYWIAVKSRTNKLCIHVYRFSKELHLSF